MPDAVGCKSRRHIDDGRGSIVLLFGFGGWYVADRLEQPAMIEPVCPFQNGVLDRLEAAPRPTAMDYFGLVDAVNGFCQSVVLAVADAADRRFDLLFCQALGVFDGYVLRPAVAMAN